MSGIINSAKQIAGDLTSGRCCQNFQKMSGGDKFKTVMKVAGIALAAGIITGILASGGWGLALGLVMMGVVGTGAFACTTSQARLGQQLRECAGKCLKTVQEAL